MRPSRSLLFNIAISILASLVVPGCAREDPVRVELRNRLKQSPQLSPEELGRVLDEVNRTLQGKVVRFQQDNGPQEFTPEQRSVVLGMLTERVGVFDEALRTEDGLQLRIINAPGISTDPEYEATRRLSIDIQTFLPRHFAFHQGVPGMPEAYSFDLVVQ